MTSTRNRILSAVLASAATIGLSDSVFAQHVGDIGVRIVDDRLDAYGAIGSEVETSVFLAEFGDTGFDGYTSNPGFDAVPGTLPPGRIGFNVLSGLRRWNPVISAWEEPVDVPERLRIGFITLETICDDDPVEGFDLAVQSDGGWHRHLDFELLGDGGGFRQPGVYRTEFTLYSTMGIAESEPFTILFDFEASDAEVAAAVDSLEPAPACPGDYDGDGRVNGADFGQLLAAFFSTDPEIDLDGDGIVTGADIGLLLSFWGDCPG